MFQLANSTRVFPPSQLVGEVSELCVSGWNLWPEVSCRGYEHRRRKAGWALGGCKNSVGYAGRGENKKKTNSSWAVRFTFWKTGSQRRSAYLAALSCREKTAVSHCSSCHAYAYFKAYINISLLWIHIERKNTFNYTYFLTRTVDIILFPTGV